MLIAVEGVDCTGKTTLLQTLSTVDVFKEAIHLSDKASNSLDTHDFLTRRRKNMFIIKRKIGERVLLYDRYDISTIVYNKYVDRNSKILKRFRKIKHVPPSFYIYLYASYKKVCERGFLEDENIIRIAKKYNISHEDVYKRIISGYEEVLSCRDNVLRIYTDVTPQDVMKERIREYAFAMYKEKAPQLYL